MIRKIAIFGAGGFGREICCLLTELIRDGGNWEFIGFFDDGLSKGTKVKYGEILGGRFELNEIPFELDLVIAIGNGVSRKKLVEGITNANIGFPTVYPNDMRFLDYSSNTLGKGNIFFSKCSLSCDVEIGDFNIFNGSISVGHDSKIGNFNTFMPASRISGDVKIGDCNLFGTSTIIIQGINIGKYTNISPGSVILKNTSDSQTYIGNPAKKFKF
jgi:sugar O-acyltransferase (sialic acid O-acetyltransferase NeuD family)